MYQVIMKHTGLPLPDLYIDSKIDQDKRLVVIRLQDHLDSALVISFCRHILEPDGIRIVDNVSHTTFEQSHIDGMYRLEIRVFGQVFDGQIVQLSSLNGAARDTLFLRPKRGQSPCAKDSAHA